MLLTLQRVPEVFEEAFRPLPFSCAARGGLLDLPAAPDSCPRWRISMWPWIKRWRDWAMHDLWPMYRIGPRPQALHFSYEKAGLIRARSAHSLECGGRPGRGDAAAAPSPANRRKTDFHLRLPGSELVPAERTAENEADDSIASPSACRRRAERHRRIALPRPRARPTDAAVPEPGRVPAKSALADADVVRAPGRRKRLPARRSSPASAAVCWPAPC